MSSQREEHRVLEEEVLIDADVHVAVPEQELIPYIEPPFDSRLRHTALGESPRDGWDRSLGGKLQSQLYKHLLADFEPETIRRDLLEEFYIDVPVLNTFGAMSRNPEPDYSLALMRAENDFLLDRFLDPADGFKGLMTLTTQRPAKAAEEIDRLAGERDIVGVYLHTTGPNPPLGDETYDVMYRAAEDHGLNVVFHGSANGMLFEFPRQNQGLNTFLEVHTLAHAWSQMLTLTSLVVEGTVEKFPDLEFAFLEAGLAWAPYLMFRLNKEYAIRRSEAPLLQHSPEHYVRDRMYFGNQPLGEPDDPRDMQRVLDLLGPDNLLFCTDYPHWDFDSPSALDAHLRETYDPADRTKVLSGNAADFFGLEG